MIYKEILSESEWESFLLKNSPQSLFQSWDWGELEKKLGKKVFRIGIYSENAGKNQLAGISQIIVVTAKRGTFLHVRHGPVFIGWDNGLVKDWLQYIVKLTRGDNAWFIRISPLIAFDHIQNLHMVGFKDAPIHSMDAEIVSVLQLSDSEDQLLANMRKTTLYLLRKAEKIGVVI